MSLFPNDHVPPTSDELVRRLDEVIPKALVQDPMDLTDPVSLAFAAGRRSLVDDLLYAMKIKPRE